MNMLVLTKILSATFPWQDTGPYETTSSFLSNYFYGGGIGWWFFFLILALAAAIWIYYDSDSRQLQASAWRIGALLAVLFLLPSIVFKLSVRQSDVNGYFEIKGQIEYLETYQDVEDWRHKVDDLQTQLTENFPPLTGLIEPIMYLGILGGLGGPVLAAAYYVTFQGQTGTKRELEAYPPPPPPPILQDSGRPSQPIGVGAPPSPSKQKVNAWLTSSGGRNYQLNQGVTTIGRSSKNDIQLGGDTTISKGHAKIIEKNGHFRLVDLGSTNGTLVNGKRVREPVLLAPNDELRVGDHTKLRFVTSQR